MLFPLSRASCEPSPYAAPSMNKHCKSRSVAVNSLDGGTLEAWQLHAFATFEKWQAERHQGNDGLPSSAANSNPIRRMPTDPARKHRALRIIRAGGTAADKGLKRSYISRKASMLFRNKKISTSFSQSLEPVPHSYCDYMDPEAVSAASPIPAGADSKQAEKKTLKLALNFRRQMLRRNAKHHRQQHEDGAENAMMPLDDVLLVATKMRARMLAEKKIRRMLLKKCGLSNICASLEYGPSLSPARRQKHLRTNSTAPEPRSCHKSVSIHLPYLVLAEREGGCNSCSFPAGFPNSSSGNGDTILY